MLAGYVPQGVHLKSFNSLKDMGKVQAETTLQNPRIVKDSSMDAGQKVTWDCVWFGSYPQSEVTAEDGAIYTKLKKKAEWNNNNTVIEGTKYRRFKGEDSTARDEEGLYNWNEDYTTYHYFKYEPIKWRILNTDGDEALLLADVALDDQEYNSDWNARELHGKIVV